MDAPRTARSIINSLGGYRAVAELLDVNPGAVRAWFIHGIPKRFHFDILRLARTASPKVSLSMDALLATSATGQALRKTLARRTVTRPSYATHQKAKDGINKKGTQT